MNIIIRNIKKEYKKDNEKYLAIDSISFDILEGEIVTIVGKSGFGKTSLLNILSGLDKDYKGNIIYGNNKPRISYMFQNDALLPWKSVLDNSLLGLELLKELNDKNINKVKSLLKEYGLEKYIYKKPGELSGGQKQRVALVRSLATNPDLLLLDEPFSALDYFTRILVSEDVRKIIKSNNLSAVVITHDIGEAISLGDKVVVLSDAPSKVKNIYKTNFKNDETIIQRKYQGKYNELYEKIWKDLNNET